MPQDNKIKIRRGLDANLPDFNTEIGELRYSTDTKKLYIDDGTANRYIGGDINAFPISTATQTALDTKLSIETTYVTGTEISFTNDRIYGSLASPETGNITANTTNAKLGVTNIIIHNSGTAPTFGSQFKKLSGSGNYATGVVNYIYCTYISATEIIYSINQRA